MGTATRAWASLPLALLLAMVACDDTNQPRTGALRLTVITTGGDLDLNGYIAAVDGAAPLAVPANGSAVIADLPTGSHGLAFTDVAVNCTPSVQNPSAANVAGGDTTDVAIAFACVATGVRITTTTTGLDLDPDGYAISIDGVLAGVVGVNDTLEITRLAVGNHTIGLVAVAANCTVAPAGTQPRDLALGQVAAVDFDLSCSAVTGMIEVNAATSGLDLDPNGYTVEVDGGSPQVLPINGTVRFPGLAAGDHSVTFGGAAGNCAVGGANPRTLPVTTGGAARDTARTTFDVSCVATTGIIEVTAATSGVELDPNGYTVKVDSGVPVPLAINGTARFEGLSGGDHSVTLDNAAGNCTIGGDNPRTLPVTVGGTTRDTARTTFAVTCLATTGTLKVTAATSGVELDPNGYSVLVDETCYIGYYGYEYCYYAWTGSVGANGTVNIPGLAVGEHTVRIDDVASNCAVAGDNPRTASVPPGDTVEVAFTITCVARGGIRVAVTTTGVDLDPNGYTVVASGPSPVNGDVAVNDTISFPGLLPGAYQVNLTGVTANCTVVGDNPRAIVVTSADTTDVAFVVTCVELGGVQITAMTTGVDLDPNGYNVSVSGPTDGAGNVAANGTITLSGLPPGDYQMMVGGVTLNCDLAGQNPRPVTVASGAPTPVTLDVACTTAAQLAVEANVNGNTDVYLVKSNGTSLTRLTTSAGYDAEPAWAPDGSAIAFVSDRDGNAEIYVMDATGSGQVRRTVAAGREAAPAWSPDGSKIAFVSVRDGNPEIYVMNADGMNQVRLTNHAASDEQPAWSPDGSKIAFASNRDGNFEIYTMNADGSGSPTRLTINTVDDLQPAWSPNGAKLVFSQLSGCDYSYCDYDLFVMDAGGSNAVRLTASSSDNDAAWSPDGSWIAFGASLCDYYNGCYYTAVQAVRTDGSRRVEITDGLAAFHPAWKP